MNNINFDNTITDTEKVLITKWITENKPKTHEHIKVGEKEYVLTIVCDDAGNAVAYNVIKPKEINIPNY